MDPFLGEIRLFGFNFAPVGWALCNGQIVAISTNTALFSLLGTFYGGNGTTTFALPNLQSRVPIGQGQGTGLSPYVSGQIGGDESVGLSVQQMPQHNHLVNADASNGLAISPSSGNLAQVAASGTRPTVYNGYTTGTPVNPVQMSGNTVALAGGNQPHPNMPPYLALNFCIALQGIYPSRS